MEALTFVGENKSIPVTLTFETEEDMDFKLVEMNGLQRERYIDQLRKRMDKKGNPTKMEGMQGDIVAQCLKDQEGKPVDRKTIDQLPTNVLEALASAAAELCGIVAPVSVQPLYNHVDKLREMCFNSKETLDELDALEVTLKNIVGEDKKEESEGNG